MADHSGAAPSPSMIDAVIIVPGTKQDLRYCIADYQIQCTQYRTKQDLYSCVPDDQIQLLNMEQNRISTTVFLVIKYNLFNMEQNKICTAVLLMIKFTVLNVQTQNSHTNLPATSNPQLLKLSSMCTTHCTIRSFL